MATGILFERELFCNNRTNAIGSGTPYGGSATADTPAAYTSESWTFASVTGWPAAQNASVPTTGFRIANTNPSYSGEIMAVINVSGVTCTVLRGIEGTTTVAHPGGSSFTALATAGTLQGFKQASQAASSPVVVGNTTAEIVVASYLPTSDELETGASFEAVAFGSWAKALGVALPTIQWTLYWAGSTSTGLQPGNTFVVGNGTLLARLLTGINLPALLTTIAASGNGFDVNGTVIWLTATTAVANLNWWFNNAATIVTTAINGQVSNSASGSPYGSQAGPLTIAGGGPIILTAKWSVTSTANTLTASAPLIYRAA